MGQRIRKIRITPKDHQRIKRKIKVTRLKQKKGGATLNKFDFSYDEYQKFLKRCPFTDDEKIIIEMRRKEKSVTYIALSLNVSERTVSRKIKSICKKILKEI